MKFYSKANVPPPEGIQRLPMEDEDQAPDGGGRSGGLPWPWKSRPTMGKARPEPLYSNPSPVTPYQPTVAQNAPGVSGGPSGISSLLGGLGVDGVLKILATVLGIKGLTSGGGSSQNGNLNLDASMKEAIDLQSGRLKKSEPLYDSIMKMSGGLLPTQYLSLIHI